MIFETFESSRAHELQRPLDSYSESGQYSRQTTLEHEHLHDSYRRHVAPTNPFYLLLRYSALICVVLQQHGIVYFVTVPLRGHERPVPKPGDPGYPMGYAPLSPFDLYFKRDDIAYAWGVFRWPQEQRRVRATVSLAPMESTTKQNVMSVHDWFHRAAGGLQYEKIEEQFQHVAGNQRSEEAYHASECRFQQ